MLNASGVRPNILAQQLAGGTTPRQVVIRQPLGATGSPTLQKLVPGTGGAGTVVVSGGQVFTTSTGQHIVVTSNAQTGTTSGVVGGSPGAPSHFVIAPGNRIATINGQQVLIRTGTNNSVLTLASPSGQATNLQPTQGNIPNMLVKTVAAPGSPVKTVKTPILNIQQTPVQGTPIQVCVNVFGAI
jgi:hypothetical protein